MAGCPVCRVAPAGARPRPSQQRRKSKSGNPAKRAAEERAAADRAGQARHSAAGSAFGLSGGSAGPGAAGGGRAADIDPASLPKGFEKFLQG